MKIKSIYVIVINTQAGASNSKLISLTHMGTCCYGKKKHCMQKEVGSIPDIFVENMYNFRVGK